MTGPSQWVRPPSTPITMTNSGMVRPKTLSTVTKPICNAYTLPATPPSTPLMNIASIL
jgi:hypothetical protein